MSGIERIAAERSRQIEIEGFPSDHDDKHADGEMALAAACYAAPSEVGELCIRTSSAHGIEHYVSAIPKGKNWYKKHTRMRQLEIAGALIAAEIDRLERTGEK